MPALDQGGYRQRQRLFGNNPKRRKAAIVHLLLAAIGIQRNNLYSFRIMKIGHRRIIESKMIVFSNAHADDIGWQPFQKSSISLAFCSRVFGIAMQIVDRLKRRLIEQVFF